MPSLVGAEMCIRDSFVVIVYNMPSHKNTYKYHDTIMIRTYTKCVLVSLESVIIKKQPSIER